ncbi:MAG: hypothetical protein AAGA93_10730 [Actinomycetota bacterium]
MSDTLDTIFVDISRYEIGFNNAREVPDYDVPVAQGAKRPQKRDEDSGFPLWRVSVTMTCREMSERKTIVVQVPSRDEPTGEFDDQIQFGNLVCRPWGNQNGSGQRWQADSCAIGQAPSASRAPTAAPPAAKAKAEPKAA